jgi:hypothetical protein
MSAIHPLSDIARQSARPGQAHSALSYTTRICQPVCMIRNAILSGKPEAPCRLDMRPAKPLPRRDVLNIQGAKHAQRLNILNIRAGTAPR